jgi:hypothetical protein
MTRTEGLKANEVFFINLLTMLKEGGIWMFPANMQTYVKINGRFITANKKALEDVLSITPINIHHLFSFDATILNPNLN